MVPINQSAYHAIYFDRHADGTAIEAAPVGILIHHGGGNEKSDTFILTGQDPQRKAGCHYYVNRAGTIYQLCPDTYAPWHAGAMAYTTKRWWGNNAAAFGIVNGNRLIGIETEHRPGQDWPAVQMTALRLLCESLVTTYQFPLHRLGAHKWYADRRKTDPADWSDADMQEWFRRLYHPAEGVVYRVAVVQGARIRQGPGTSFPIAATLPEGYTFWSDATTIGQAIDGNNVWVHFAGPTPTIPNPLGFIFSGIVQELPS